MSQKFVLSWLKSVFRLRRRALFYAGILALATFLLFMQGCDICLVYRQVHQKADVTNMTGFRGGKWLFYLQSDWKANVCSYLQEKYKDWNIVIVAQLKPRSLPGCGYFPVYEEGAEYSIKKGATEFYFTTDPYRDVILSHASNAGFWRKTRNLVYSSKTPSTFLPSNGWYCATSEGKRHVLNKTYQICKNANVGLETVLQVPKEKKLSLKTMPPLVLNQGTFVNIRLMNLLVRHESLWALPMLMSNHSEIAQKLLWMTGSLVKIHYALEPVHSPETNISGLMVYLSDYRCSFPTFVSCAEDMFYRLLQQHLISRDIHTKFTDWFVLLKSTKYTFPSLSDVDSDMKCLPRLVMKYCAESKQEINTTYQNSMPISTLHRNTCGSETLLQFGLKNRPQHGTKWDDILMVVTFNYQLYKSIPYIEVMYRRIFPNILYCAPTGPWMPNQYDYLKDLDLEFVFYRQTPRGHLNGTYFYECLVLAAAMRYDVSGYLVVADDSLLVPENLNRHDRNHVWFSPHVGLLFSDFDKNLTCRLKWNEPQKQCLPLNAYPPFEKYRKQILSSYKRLEEMSKSSSRIHGCLERLRKITNGTRRVLGTYPDGWYVPSTAVDSAAELMELFVQESVFLSIAVATTLNCVAPQNDYEAMNVIYAHPKVLPIELPGAFVPGKKRRLNTWEFVNQETINSLDYMHPYKLSAVHRHEQTHVRFFCRYVGFLHGSGQLKTT